ncbi:hypothetical protein HG536_0E04760 [Torulaspora globosa]|uniref:Skg3/CAF120-like PH-like domain-containing protein n=1 Tax=Torulaspora globosa TaxID=48254 RepID=A0A7G3ZJ79_9SACH|nr:uncharacterized protein HG536_0E04760 [Torulaspora globosa]QLL33565.1 hypothetical protein HG536_0E04760 [Torulaspora globosa]
MRLLTSLRSSVNISRQGPAKVGNSKSIAGEDVALASPSSAPRTFRSLPQDLLDGIKPLLVLLQAHSRKTYYEWALDTLTQDIWQITSKDRPTHFYPVRKLLLVGTEVIVEAEELGACKVSLVEQNDRVQRLGIEVSGQVLSLNGGEVVFTCTNPSSLKDMEKLCLLSVFEYYSILKSVTGTIISGLGIILSDMHVVLSSAFNYKDWCEIYLQDQGWLKVWCHIDKVGKRGSGSQQSGRCQIKFYKDRKQASSSNLVCFIPDCEYTQDMFFYKDCKQASPDYSQMDLQEFLENLNMIKIVGNVCFPQEGFQKNRSRSSSTMSFLNGNETSSKRSSVAASPKSTSSRLKALSPTKGQHRRKTSELSLDSNHSQYKDLENCITDPKGLLIRPLSHNGVHHLEAMIRMIIPMMDCTRLYGRPSLFKSNRSHPESLMFGLPKLPTVDYFAREELSSLHMPGFEAGKFPSTDSNAVAMHYYSRSLHEKMTQDPHRDRKLSFRQLASITDHGKEQLPVLEKQEGSFLGSLTSLMV